MDKFDVQSARDRMRVESREQAESIFKLAGMTYTHTWELANPYWPLHPDYDDVRRPWWLFLTPIGPVRIGWRKRVLQIDWDACAVRAIVTEDDVTKDTTMVHAYSVENAVTYLRTLRVLATR